MSKDYIVKQSEILRKEESIFDKFNITEYYDNIAIADVNISRDKLLMLYSNRCIEHLTLKDSSGGRKMLRTDKEETILHWKERNEYNEVLSVFMVGEKAIRARTCRASYTVENGSYLDILEIKGGYRTDVIVNGAGEIKVYETIYESKDKQAETFENIWENIGTNFSVEWLDDIRFRCNILRGTYDSYKESDFVVIHNIRYGSIDGDPRIYSKIINKKTQENILGEAVIESAINLGNKNSGLDGLYIIKERIDNYWFAYHLVDLKNNGKILINTERGIIYIEDGFIKVTRGLGRRDIYEFDGKKRELILKNR